MYPSAPDEHIHVGVLRLVVYVPESRSLKEKRRVLSRLKDRVSARHRLTLAEVGHLESHQSAVLATSLCANDARLVRSQLDQVIAEAAGLAEAHLLNHHAEVFPFSRQE